MFLYETHIIQTKISIFLICSWWGFGAKTMLPPQGPPHFSIHALFIKACTCSIIILYSFVLYWGFLRHTGFSLPASMENLYRGIIRFAPSLQNKSQYFFTIAINCSFISSITLLFNLMCLCSSSLWFSSFNVIIFLRLPSYHICLRLNTALPYWWKSNTPLSMSFSQSGGMCLFWIFGIQTFRGTFITIVEICVFALSRF